MNAVIAESHQETKPLLLARLAERYGIQPDKMLSTLKATAFKGDVSNEQMMALLVVAEAYSLNPWLREIFAFPDRNNGIVPVVGVDGWSRIINSHPQFDGMEFKDGELNKREVPAWIECTIYRKDRTRPTTAREYFDEVNRDIGPWKTHPRRMLRHKAMIQASRLAFGFAGIHDPDEAERIIEAQPRDLGPRYDAPIDFPMRDKWVGQITDTLNADKEEHDIAGLLREIDVELNRLPELYTQVLDQLAAQKIISKGKWREYLKIMPPTESSMPQ